MEAGKGAKVQRESLVIDDRFDPLLEGLERLFEALFWGQFVMARLILPTRHIR